MEGTPIAFRMATYDRDEASELVKRLLGRATSGRGGRYVVRRNELLDGIPLPRRIRGVVIVRTQDAGRAAALLEELGADVHVRRVELTREDRGVSGCDPRSAGGSRGSSVSRFRRRSRRDLRVIGSHGVRERMAHRESPGRPARGLDAGFPGSARGSGSIAA